MDAVPVNMRPRTVTGTIQLNVTTAQLPKLQKTNTRLQIVTVGPILMPRRNISPPSIITTSQTRYLTAGKMLFVEFAVPK